MISLGCMMVKVAVLPCLLGGFEPLHLMTIKLFKDVNCSGSNLLGSILW